MRPYCAGAFLFYGHESDAFRRPVFTWYELSKINAHTEYTAKKSPANLSIYRTLCGERGIRTPGTSQYAGFQDRCIRPLCHLSMGCEISGCVNEKTLASVSIRKRRERDSNPRYLSVRRFSRPVHSTTLPSLQ
jgi:hypothetical protein